MYTVQMLHVAIATTGNAGESRSFIAQAGNVFTRSGNSHILRKTFVGDQHLMLNLFTTAAKESPQIAQSVLM